MAILVDATDDYERDMYESLIRWIDGIIPTEAKELSSKAAVQKWVELSE